MHVPLGDPPRRDVGGTQDPSDLAREATFFETLGQPLRFDHRRILATAIGRIRAKIKYRPVIFELMPNEFTLFELQKTVEAILAEAALANAQLAVAKAVLKAEFRREGATVEEAVAKAEEAVEKMANQLVFGRVPVGTKTRPRRVKSEVKVLYFRSLFEAEEDAGEA